MLGFPGREGRTCSVIGLLRWSEVTVTVVGWDRDFTCMVIVNTDNKCTIFDTSKQINVPSLDVICNLCISALSAITLIFRLFSERVIDSHRSNIEMKHKCTIVQYC